jgi:hypothetical protein
MMDRPMLRELLHGLSSFNGSSNSPALEFDKDSNSMDGGDNTLKSILKDLVMDRVMQQRVTHIAFGCVSAALAVFVIIRIWRDSWRASQLQVQLRAK